MKPHRFLTFMAQHDLSLPSLSSFVVSIPQPLHHLMLPCTDTAGPLRAHAPSYDPEPSISAAEALPYHPDIKPALLHTENNDHDQFLQSSIASI